MVIMNMPNEDYAASGGGGGGDGFLIWDNLDKAIPLVRCTCLSSVPDPV